MDRYKFKNSKFCSASDAKKLRVLQAQDNRKLQRSNTFFQNRVIFTPAAKCEVGAPTKPSTSKCQTSAKEIKDLSKLRYQKMLLFKEQKKRIKERDREKRRPVFHTGLYQPIAPSFLSAKKEGMTTMATPTPFKSISRSKKAGVTPATINSKKCLKFATNPTSSLKDNFNSKKLNVSTRVTRSSKKAEFALTKCPTKLSPKSQKKTAANAVLSTRNKKEEKSVRQRITTPGWRSFAPKHFKFMGLPGVEPIKLDGNADKAKKKLVKDTKVTKDKENKAPKKMLRSRKVTEEKDDPECVYLSPHQKIDMDEMVPAEPQAVASFHTDVPKIDSPLPLVFSDEDTEECGNEASDSEAKLISLLEPSKHEEICQSSDNMNTLIKSIIKKQNDKKTTNVSFVIDKENRYKGTPIPRRSSRIARLSLLPGLFNSEDSESESQHDAVDVSKELLDLTTPKSSSKRNRTPASGGKSLKKGSISSLRRKRLSKQATPLERMFFDVPHDSPIPLNFSDEDEERSAGDETLSDADVKLMDQIQPFKSVDQSPENGEKSTRKSIIRKTKKKSNLSVSFIATKSPQKKILHKGTPIPRRSNRIARLSLLPGLYDKEYSPFRNQISDRDPSQDLINFDTPKSAPRSSKRPSRSSRLSSLPDFTT